MLFIYHVGRETHVGVLDAVQRADATPHNVDNAFSIEQ